MRHCPKTWLPTLTILSVLIGGISATQAATVMQQCGQQYQAAKAAGTLNGMTWNQFRSDCSAKLKAQPASTEAAPAPAAPAPTPAAAPAANPLKPAPAATTAAAPAAPAAETPAATGAKKPMTAGQEAFHAREKQCGSEWRTNKVSLKAQTPGLTWPKYLSQCNTRLKAAGQ